jgi:peptide/nickel transport system ATP-binding protein
VSAGRLFDKVLIADEPTTALDATVQAEILDLLRDMRRTFNLALLLITHDLGVVAEMADRVAVMYAGRIVEHGTTTRIFAAPSHPYTQALLASIPGAQPGRRLQAIPGNVPAIGSVPEGCAFGPRCPHRFDACLVAPPMVEVGPRHDARCYLPGQAAGGRR